MKVALLVPPSPFLFDPMTFPPLGVLYLSAYLKIRGHDVTVYDYNDPKDRFLKNWKRVEDSDVIGFTLTTPQFSEAVMLLGRLKRAFPDKYFVAGGPHASCDPQSCVDVGFDRVIVGPGEHELAILTAANLIRTKPKIISAEFPSPGFIDILPFPDRSAVDLKHYKYKIDGSAATSIITQRGCSYSCAFCCHWPGYQHMRFRRPDSVVQEIDEVKNIYGYEAFMVWDDEFNLNRERTLKLCRALKPLEIKFRCFIRSNLFDAELGKAMQDAGCVEVGCGVESGSQKVLTTIGKQTTVGNNTQARSICRMLGIRFKAFTIIGLPGEDEQSVQETREWIRKNEPDEFDVTINTPYPGSREWDHSEQFDLIFDKEAMRRSFYDGSYYKGPPKSPVATKALSAERIVQLRNEIEDEFNRTRKSRELWTK